MAAARPMAVANRASAMAGATVVRLVLPAEAMASKAFMIPQTVPNRPMKGLEVATTDSTPSPVSIRWLSRAIRLSSARSMREISRWLCASLIVWRARASRQSVTATTSIRGRIGSGLGPA